MFIKQIVKYGSLLIGVSVVVVLCLQFLVQPAHAQPQQLASMSVFYQGLANPRGLKFGPDGYLYVAEGGPAKNTLSTVGQCEQVPSELPQGPGPYTGGFNSSIVKISPDGTQLSIVADDLPSSQIRPEFGSSVSGVADLAFVGSNLYGIEAGAGCSHGLAGTDNTLFRVNPDGTTTTIADLSQFQKANPVAQPEADDFEPDGTWYSMAAVGSNFYAVEPNHGELDRILVNGQITRLADISAKEGHIVPTAVVYHKGDFYVGNLNGFPVAPGSSMILKIDQQGNLTEFAHGLTTVVGLAFDTRGRLYALETDTFGGAPPIPPAAGSGMVVRVNDDSTLTTIVSGLVFPSAMTFGPDGALYVSNFGFNVPDPVSGPEPGQVVRIAIND